MKQIAKLFIITVLAVGVLSVALSPKAAAQATPTDAQRKAACQASSGRWEYVGVPPDGADACICPANQAPSATGACVNMSSTSGGGGSTGTSDDGNVKLSLDTKDNLDKEAASKKYQCGKGTNTVNVAFDFGCLGNNYKPENAGAQLNPILDVTFAIFRFLTAGVGLLVIMSIIIAGIQYSASRGNPQATQAAIKRITNAIIGLLIYIFMFAILNFIVPGGLFL